MTPEQIEKAKALSKCSFLPASTHKRFARDIGQMAIKEPEKELSQKHLAYLTALFHTYRKQMPEAHKNLCDCLEAQTARRQSQVV